MANGFRNVTWSRGKSQMSAILFFEILANTVFKFLCFILFLAIDKFVITRYPIVYGVWIKMKHVAVMRKWCKKIGIEIFDNKWLISHELVWQLGLDERVKKRQTDLEKLVPCMSHGISQYATLKSRVANHRLYRLYIVFGTSTVTHNFYPWTTCKYTNTPPHAHSNQRSYMNSWGDNMSNSSDSNLLEVWSLHSKRKLVWQRWLHYQASSCQNMFPLLNLINDVCVWVCQRQHPCPIQGPYNWYYMCLL